MTKLAPEWVGTSHPVIRSPARYRWTTAPTRCKTGNGDYMYLAAQLCFVLDALVVLCQCKTYYPTLASTLLSESWHRDNLTNYNYWSFLTNIILSVVQHISITFRSDRIWSDTIKFKAVITSRNLLVCSNMWRYSSFRLGQINNNFRKYVFLMFYCNFHGSLNNLCSIWSKRSQSPVYFF